MSNNAACTGIVSVTGLHDGEMYEYELQEGLLNEIY